MSNSSPPFPNFLQLISLSLTALAIGVAMSNAAWLFYALSGFFLMWSLFVLLLRREQWGEAGDWLLDYFWKGSPNKSGSSLEIFFDQKNPNKQFWSDEMWWSVDRPIFGSEYRLEIRNKSKTETLKNVHVLADIVQDGSLIQTTLVFTRTEKEHCDINPNSYELVRLMLVQPGPDVVDYDEIRVRASAESTPEERRVFYMDSTAVPALLHYQKRKIIKYPPA